MANGIAVASFCGVGVEREAIKLTNENRAAFPDGVFIGEVRQRPIPVLQSHLKPFRAGCNCSNDNFKKRVLPLEGHRAMMEAIGFKAKGSLWEWTWHEDR